MRVAIRFIPLALLLTAHPVISDAQSPSCNIPSIISAFNAQGYLQLNVGGQPCHLYFYNSSATPNWQTAQNQAAALGANLASVRSQAENDSIVAAAQRAGLSGGVWIGFTDRVTEGNWVWEDGSPVTFTNWNPGEPSNSGGVPCYNDEDGTVLQLGNGRWNDLALNNGCPFATAFASVIKVSLCPQVIAASNPQPVCLTLPVDLLATTQFGSQPYSYTWRDASTQAQVGTGSPLTFVPAGDANYIVISTDIYGCTATVTVSVTTQICQLPTCNLAQIDAVMSAQGFLYLNVQGQPCARYYYNSNRTPNWQTAQSQAQSVGANLISISDAAENNAVRQAALAAGLSGGVWIGYTDQASEGNWVWVDGNPSAYTNWHPGEPNNSGGFPCYNDEDGAVLQLGSGLWNDLALNNPCPGAAAFASIIKVNLCPQVTATAQPNPVCQTLPVNLNATTLFGSQPFSYTWREATTQTQVGTGPAISFPATGPGTYEVTMVDAYGCSGSAVTSFTTQVCQLPQCDVSQVDALMAQQGFVYLNVQTEPCGRYFYNPNTTRNWNTAQSQAAAVGATLLTIRDLAENNAVWQAAVAAGVSGGLWIGYTDRVTEGVWVWEDGSTSTFTNWNAGEPNNTTDICSGSGEDAAIMQMSNGRWNDVYVNPGGLCFGAASYASLIKVNLCPVVTVNDAAVCAGNSTSLTASTVFGSQPYTYAWSTGQAGNSISVSPATTTDYSVTVTDRWGCSDADTARVTVNGVPQPVLNVNPAGACENEPVTVSITSPVSPTAAYNWNFDGGATLSGSGSGPYQVQWSTAGTKNISLTINDAGCISPPGTVAVIISVQPAANAGSDAAICSGGTVTLGAAATPGFAYQWDPVTNLSNANASNPLFSASNTGSSPITETLVVFTANGGCFDYDTVRVTINPSQRISLIADGPVIFCGGDSVGFSVAGNFASYNWSTGATTPTITVTQTFSYSLTAIDGNGCEYVSDTVAVNASGAGPVIALDSLRNVSCAGLADGYLQISASAGTPGYTYRWSTNPQQTTPAISNLAAGAYSITVTDQLFCETTAQYVITAPAPMSISLNQITDASCNGVSDGSVAVAVSGGTPAYNFSWSTSPQQTSATASGLAAGSYTVTVTDQNGCTIAGSYTVGLLPQTLAVMLDSVVDASCHNTADGIIQVVATGGTPQYSYRWNTSPAQFTSTAVNLFGGAYEVTVTDASGCTVSGQYTVGAPAPIIVTASVVNATCHGDSDGSITAAATGGSAPYSFLWMEGTSGTQLAGLRAGSYTVTVTDAANCSEAETFAVNEPPLLNLVVSPRDTSVFRGASFTYFTSVNTGTSITWQPATFLSCTDCFSPAVTPLDSIAYFITATDANGCSDADTVIIRMLPNKILNIPNAFSPNGDGVNDVFTVWSPATKRIKLAIFDRWGSLVFVGEDVTSVSWDGTFHGKLLDPAVFVYDVYAEFIDRTIQRSKGSVTLVR